MVYKVSLPLHLQIFLSCLTPQRHTCVYNMHSSHFPGIPFIHSINKRHLCARPVLSTGVCSEQNRQSFCPHGLTSWWKQTDKKQICNRWSGGKCYGEKDLARKAIQSNTTNSMICKLKTSNPHVFKSTIILLYPLLYLHFNLNFILKI